MLSSKVKTCLTSYIWHLKQSLTNSEFYYIIYTKYKDYGLRYIFNISFIANFLIFIYIFSIAISFNNYFSTGQTNVFTEKVDNILNNLPPIHYDGKKFTSTVESPVEISKNIILDLNKELVYRKYSAYILVISEKSLIANLGEGSKKIEIPYNSILGPKPIEISKQSIRSFYAAKFASYILPLEQFMIIIIGPIFFFLKWVELLLSQSGFIVICYLICRIAKIDINLRQSSRLVFYAIAPSLLVEPLAYILPQSKFLYSLLKLWTFALMLKGILRYNNMQKVI